MKSLLKDNSIFNLLPNFNSIDQGVIIKSSTIKTQVMKHTINSANEPCWTPNN